MRFLLITNDFYPNSIGGMTHYYTGLAEAFGRESIAVLTVAAENPIERDPDCLVVRSTVRGKKSGAFLAKRRMRQEALRLVKELNIDVVLCGNVRPYGDIAYDLHRICGLPYYVFFHGNDLLRILKRMRGHYFKRLSYGRMLQAPRGFIANSRFVMGLIPPEYKKDKSLIVANPGINPPFENLPPEPPFADSETIRLLSVGRLDRRKGVEHVLEALALLRDDHPRLVYDVVGAGPKEFYERRAAQLGVSDNVTFHGFKSYGEVMNFFRNSDVFIMVSFASDKDMEVEGFGIVYLEAGACGKPVIGSMTGGIEDAVVDGKTGLLVKDPFNAAEIAEKIAWLCHHPKEAAAMGSYGHQRVNESFKYSSIASALKQRITEDLARQL